MVYGVPDNLRVDGKVRVHQTVAHGPHQVPWHLRMRSLDIFRDMARGFADNDEVELNGPHGFGIILKRVEGYPLCEGCDFSKRVQNIPYALAPGSRRHECFPLTPVRVYVASDCRACLRLQRSRGRVPDSLAGRRDRITRLDGQRSLADPRRWSPSPHCVRPSQTMPAT